MVLCAGFGTRLRPLTDELPKPLVPIGDRSLLEHVLERLGEAGLLPVVANGHHLFDIFQRITSSYAGVSKVIEEPEIRGTAGGVAGARDDFAPGPVLVTNGDVLAAFDAADLLAHAPGAGLCLAVAPRPVGQGSVGLGEGGRVVRLRGERFGEELAAGDYVGTMAIGPRALAELPASGCLIGDVALPLLLRGGSVIARPLAGAWSAPGDGIPQYLDANRAWLAERVGPEGSFVGRGARIALDVTLRSSVIGDGAELSGSGLVERVVLWPGARAAAPLADCVVTTSGRLAGRA
ncbi:MAG TPA: sugar phosphate nucleotidyltransferase [Polyangiaceae bacterium]